MVGPNIKKLVNLSLSLLLVAQGVGGVLPARAAEGLLTGDVRVTVSPANIHETVPIAGADRKVTMALRGVDIRDALRALAQKGGFNVLIDESVAGQISVDLNDVTIQNALETLKTYGKLAYAVDGKNLMVADAGSEKGQAYQKTATRVIPLRHANAKVVADLLNKTIFADRANAAGGNSAAMPVTPDFHTNSLLLVGSPTDIKLVQEHVAALDVPREMRTWRLSQANALDVATLLSSSLFNEGRPVISTSGGGGGSAGGAGGGNSAGAASPSAMRVTAENIEEGTGTSQASQSGGSGGQNSSVVNSMTLRARVKESQTIQISPTGPIIIPDTRLNSITLLGTAEQIAMAEALIPTLDRKVPQVVLEASLIEVSEDGRKELGFNFGANSGYFSTGTNNSPGATDLMSNAFSNIIGRSTSTNTPTESIYRFTTNPVRGMRDMVYQLHGLVSKNKAKILANPTVVTASDSETIISIVDEVVRSVTVTQGFGVPNQATINLGEAGIVLNILPKVSPDKTVSLRVRPVVSTVAGTERDNLGNTITLLSKREVLAQNVVLRDGQTFMLGGLIHNTNNQTVTQDPILSKLPIVSALARNSTGSKGKTELVVLITPHIVNDESTVARSKPSVPGSGIVPATLSNRPHSNFVPVSLTDTSHSNGVLPPLEKVHVLNADTVLEKGEASGAKPAPKPFGSQSLKPEELMPAPQPRPAHQPVTPAMSAASKPEPKRIEPVAKPVSEEDISDEAIRAIMEKFK